MKQLTINDLAQLFGAGSSDVATACAALLPKVDLSYRFANDDEHDSLVLETIKRMSSAELPVAGEKRLADWERGWSENLQALRTSAYDIEKLVPKYIRPGEPIRLFRKYAIPAPNFVRDYTVIFRAWLAQTFIAKASTIYEFGCGPGAHLAYLASTFPDKRFVGLDWAESSSEILTALSARFGWNIKGERFDFFNPNHAFDLERDSAVLTFGALEQVGGRFGPFLDYLLSNKPAIVVHVEPMDELYEQDNLIDYLAWRYHKQRGYLDGFLTKLKTLEKEGKVTIVASHRHEFGVKYVETYSYVVWHPN